MKLNNINEERVTIINAAVGDTPGELEYLPHPYSFLSKLHKEDIEIYDFTYKAPLIRLDDYFAQQGCDPDLLKIDIDGGETMALRGMSRILKDKRPDLLLEVHPQLLTQIGSSASEVCNILREFDYHFFLVPDFRSKKSGALRPLSDFRTLASATGDMVFVTSDTAQSGPLLGRD